MFFCFVFSHSYKCKMLQNVPVIGLNIVQFEIGKLCVQVIEIVKKQFHRKSGTKGDESLLIQLLFADEQWCSVF
jgi:hypothetical protein